ncbi:MAG: cellulase family glycosylhydrolase [Bacteroidaceae bacterium]|nr:cellulase family glycosylhydrolase [Bacteroidaceae bacterium]
MRRLVYIFAMITLAGLFACQSDKSDNSSIFVTVRDGKFYRGEAEYKFIGANFWYGAVLASEGQGGDRERLAKELDLMQEVGITNVRVLASGEGTDTVATHVVPVLQPEPGVYNDTLLRGLDYLIAELEKRDMTAVLFLNNSWEWSGGYGAYLDWAGCGPVPDWSDWDVAQRYHCQFVQNDKAKEMAENHVRFIVSRTNTVTGKPYSESPAIMAWELANEPRAFARDSVTKVCFANWIEAQAKLIKSLDPNHLVTTGSEGIVGCEEDPNLFRQIHAFPEIDYICIHIWPYNWHWLGPASGPLEVGLAQNGEKSTITSLVTACQNTSAYLDECYEAVKDLNKPMVLEEFGYPRDGYLIEPGSPTLGRDGYYAHVFSMLNGGGRLSGCCFWAWGGYAQPQHTRWQRWDDYVGDPAQEEQGLNAVFACDTITLGLIRKASESLNHKE